MLVIGNRHEHVSLVNTMASTSLDFAKSARRFAIVEVAAGRALDKFAVTPRVALGKPFGPMVRLASFLLQTPRSFPLLRLE